MTERATIRPVLIVRPLEVRLGGLQVRLADAPHQGRDTELRHSQQVSRPVRALPRLLTPFTAIVAIIMTPRLPSPARRGRGDTGAPWWGGWGRRGRGHVVPRSCLIRHAAQDAGRELAAPACGCTIDAVIE